MFSRFWLFTFPGTSSALPLAAMFVTDGLPLNCALPRAFQHTLVFDGFDRLTGGYLSHVASCDSYNAVQTQLQFFRLDRRRGLLGAVIFYLVTNTVSLLFNPFHNP